MLELCVYLLVQLYFCESKNGTCGQQMRASRRVPLRTAEFKEMSHVGGTERQEQKRWGSKKDVRSLSAPVESLSDTQSAVLDTRTSQISRYSSAHH